jgi:hypothetical protein
MNSCEYCEEIFTPAVHNQKYCSKDCYSEMNSMRALARYYEEGGKQRSRKSFIKHKYGLEWDRYIEMLDEHGNRCAICGRHREEFDKELVVDHDHKTGKVRGLLCYACNTGIGNLQDSVDLLKKAQEYLLEKGE